MEASQAAEWHEQSRAGNVSHERLNGCPVDEPGVVGTTAQEPASQASRAGVDARDDPLPFLGAQLDVVRDHETAGVHADEPPAEHVITEQHLSLAPLEMGEVRSSPASCTLPGFISAIRSRGMNRRRPAMRPTRPVTGG